MYIRMLTAAATDPESLRQFYCDVLELELADETDDSFTVVIGETELEFRQYTGSQDPQYHFAINIPANKIEEAAAWLKDRVSLLYIPEYESDIADFTNWRARSVYFLDPAGNIIELIARFDFNNAAADSFSSHHFLSVSEVGIVFPVADFDARTTQLLADFNLHYFRKQPPLEHFRAVGDEEGLFIIVPENRPWYPTQNRNAVASPLKVYFSQGNTDGLLEYDQEEQTWSNRVIKFG